MSSMYPSVCCWPSLYTVNNHAWKDNVICFSHKRTCKQNTRFMQNNSRYTVKQWRTKEVSYYGRNAWNHNCGSFLLDSHTRRFINHPSFALWHLNILRSKSPGSYWSSNGLSYRERDLWSSNWHAIIRVSCCVLFWHLQKHACVPHSQHLIMVRTISTYIRHKT
jgi:hypothetical protein